MCVCVCVCVCNQYFWERTILEFIKYTFSAGLRSDAARMCNYSVINLHAMTKTLAMVDSVRHMTVEKTHKYGEYGLQLI